MNTNNKGKIVVVVLVGIIVGCTLAPLFSTGRMIEAQVLAQLRRSVAPTRVDLGREERLQRILITDSQRSRDGDKYAVQFELQYTGTLRVATGCVLVRDERGHWSGAWSPVDHPPVRLFIQ